MKFIREFDNSVQEYEGQVLKAVKDAHWFTKWGLSHILYLISSHLRRFNSNFKDPSIQSYGGEIFEKNRNDCETIFCSLQQPKPSIKGSKDNTGPQITVAQACCNRSGGCFTGDSEILMKNGELKKVSELDPGDELTSWNDKTCRLICIVKTKCTRPIKVVNLNGLKITQYHPVFINKWEFPLNLSLSEEISCDYIYNLVVDKEHVVIINGIRCVTLGHDYKDDVVAHPYFGSENVLNDLKKMRGWSNGLVKIDCLLTTRDFDTGMINSMIEGEYMDNFFYRLDEMSCLVPIESH